MSTVAEANKFFNDAKATYDSLFNNYFNKPGCGQSYSFPKKVIKDATVSANWNCCQASSGCPPLVDKYNSLIDSYNLAIETEEYKNDLANKTEESKGKTTLYVVIALVIAAAAIGVGTYLYKRYKK